MQERYVNPFTDFGFKKLFGEESSKEILMDFLGTIIQDKGVITKLRFLQNEHLGASQEDRKVIFDLYCENENGEKFIVELQKAKQAYFKDRSLYYATFPIQEQAVVGDWNFKINTVYTISIMDFVFDSQNPTLFLHDVRLVDIATQQVFNDKLRFIYLEMPKFNKTEKELVTYLDKWMYVLKNLYLLDNIPAKIKEKIFTKFFEKAEIAKYSPTERVAYQNSVKVARDFKNVVETGIEEGREIGKKEGIRLGIKEGKKARDIEIAKIMKAEGDSTAKISKITGLSITEIDEI